MKNIGQMMKQAQQMQAKLEEVQKKLDDVEVTGTSGGGLVTLTQTAKGNIRSLKIDPSLVNADETEVLEDLIVAALNDGKAKAEAASEAEMSKATGGMNLPAGMKLPF